jgi:hypothetical protein
VSRNGSGGLAGTSLESLSSSNSSSSSNVDSSRFEPVFLRMCWVQSVVRESGLRNVYREDPLCEEAEENVGLEATLDNATLVAMGRAVDAARANCMRAARLPTVAAEAIEAARDNTEAA